MQGNTGRFGGATLQYDGRSRRYSLENIHPNYTTQEVNDKTLAHPGAFHPSTDAGPDAAAMLSATTATATARNFRRQWSRTWRLRGRFL